MAAYWIARAKTKNSETLKRYGELVAKAKEIYPNTVLARAGAYKVLEGPDHFDRIVILRFPSMEAALAYYNSPEYQEAVAVRQMGAEDCEILITEGLD